MNQPIDVVLNVYYLADSTDPNFRRVQALANCGLGLYHSAIEIQGVEYSYGGNASTSETGVFMSAPMSVPNATYARSYNMGTFRELAHVYDVLALMKQRFKANEYSLIHQNCNHFSEAFLLECCGSCLPSYVNRLARVGAWLACLLPE